MESASNVRDGDGCGTRLRAHLRAIAVLVGDLQPDRLSGLDARRLAEMFAWGERLCAAGKGLTVKRVVDTGAWDTGMERSAADWLARVSGQTPAQAAGTIGAAKRIAQQPDVDAAARAGRLSEQQSAALSAAAAAAPETTQELLDTARDDTLAALRERARQIRLAADEAGEKDRYRRLHEGRYLRFWTDDEGASRLSGRFTPDALATVHAALQPFQERVFAAGRAAGTRERRECHAADALVDLARAATGRDPLVAVPLVPNVASPPRSDHATATGTPESDGCDQHLADVSDGRSPGTDAGSGRQGSAGPLRPAPVTVIVRVDHAALVRGSRQADECCEIDGMGTVPVATVRAMTADAFLAAVVTDGTDIRTVVHLGRSVTALQRTALVARDVECVVPGCHTRHGLEIDHVADWAATKTTTVNALARLCHHHHAQKTYEGWRLDGPPGHWTWSPPAGQSVDPPPGGVGPARPGFYRRGSSPPARRSATAGQTTTPGPKPSIPAPVTGSLFGDDPFPP